MTEIKEVKDLNTIAGIRKATQDSIRPVIQEIQRKMQTLSQQNQQLSAKTQYMLQLQKRLGRSEESVRYMQSQLLQVREQCQNMQMQQTKEKDEAARFEEKLSEELRKMKKDKQKQDALIQNTNDKTEKVAKEIAVTLGLIKKREEFMQGKFAALNKNAESLSFQVKQTSSHLQRQFNTISALLDNELKTNEKRIKILDSYEMEKESLEKSMNALTAAMAETVKKEDYAAYKIALKKDQEKFVGSIKDMIEDSLSETTKTLLTELPQMKQSLKHCLSFEEKIDSGHTQIEHINLTLQTNNNRYTENSLQFKTEVQQHFAQIQTRQNEMHTNIEKALQFEASIQLKLNTYTEQLKLQMREQNSKRSRQLYNQIKIAFADKKEQIREKELQNIVDERLKLYNKCTQIENLSYKIGEVLTNFSTKFTRIKSDNELFIDTVNRQMTEVHQLHNTIRNNCNTIGSVIAQLTETVLVNNCIQIQAEAKANEELAFSTRCDGVIYQRYPRSKGQTTGKILYRRKLMDAKVLKKAMMTALIHVYDQLMDENCCLGWHQNSPSLFFKHNIEPLYKNISQKGEEPEKAVKAKEADTLDLNTITMIEQTVQSTILTSEQPYKKASVRSRKRYDNSGDIFATKSARKVRAVSSYGIN